MGKHTQRKGERERDDMIQNGLKQAVAEWVEKWVDSTTIHQRPDGVSLSLLLYLFRVVVVHYSLY